MYLKKFALRLPFFFARRLARLNPESEPRSEKQPFLACIPELMGKGAGYHKL
jgi:hypothetical protein